MLFPKYVLSSKINTILTKIHRVTKGRFAKNARVHFLKSVQRVTFYNRWWQTVPRGHYPLRKLFLLTSSLALDVSNLQRVSTELRLL